MNISKSICAGVLIISLSATPVMASAKTYSDMPNDWSRSSIEYAIKHNLLQGYQDNIMPDADVTRSQMAAMISRLLQLRSTDDLSSFNDVDKTAWYYEDLSKVYAAGLMVGNQNQLLPDKPLTREEAFTILARLYQLKADNPTLDLTHWKDHQEISDWSKTSIIALYEQGFIAGAGDKLLPKKTLSRKELARLMHTMAPQIIDSPSDVIDPTKPIILRTSGMDLSDSHFKYLILTSKASDTKLPKDLSKTHVISFDNVLSKSDKTGLIDKIAGFIRGGGSSSAVGKKHKSVSDYIDVDRTGIAHNGDIGRFVLVTFKTSDIADKAASTLKVDNDNLTWSKVDTIGLIRKAEVKHLHNEKLYFTIDGETYEYELPQFHS